MSVIESKRVLAALAVAGAIAVAATPAHADAAFYQGKQGRLFTMGSPGGGYDTYTRTVSAFLEKRIGVKLIPTNETAAGGMIAMNRTINATPDGLTLLLTGGEGLVTAQLYGLSGVNYDVRKQIFLARVSGEDKVAVVGGRSRPTRPSPTCRSSTGRRCGPAPARPTTIPISPPSCATRSAIKCKIILGYKGTGDMNMAIQRAEVDGRVISDEAAALYGPSSGMRVVTILARQRSEKFPDVPTIFEAAKLSTDRRAAARLARQYREPRPRDPDDARHAEGARRLSARRARGDPAGPSLHRRDEEGQSRGRLSQRRRGAGLRREGDDHARRQRASPR